ncbi:MAG: hypothetical protein R2706_15745 [Acidimicrobiales bacterium]
MPVIVADGDRLAVAVITQPAPHRDRQWHHHRAARSGGRPVPRERSCAFRCGPGRRLCHLHIEASWVFYPADWENILGDVVVVVDNPDPVPADDGSILIPVGRVDVAPADTPAFLGRPATGESALSTVVRQQLWWESLLASPPPSGSASGCGVVG